MTSQEVIEMFLVILKNGYIDILSALKLDNAARDVLTKTSTLDIIAAQIKSLSPDSTVISIDQLKVNIVDDIKSFIQDIDNFLVFYSSSSVNVLYKYQGYVFILVIQSVGIILYTTLNQFSEVLKSSHNTIDFINKFNQFQLAKSIDKPNGTSTTDYTYLCIKELIIV